MKKGKQSWAVWILGVALIVTTAGAVWVVHSHEGDDQPILPDGTQPSKSQPQAAHYSGEGAVFQGFVDVDGKLIDLNPLQPRPIVDLPVVEGQLVKAGQVLLKVDDRQAVNNVELAEAALKAANADLEDARKGPAQLEIALSMQSKKIDAMSFAMMAAKDNLDHNEKLAKGGQIDEKDADASRHLYERAKAAWQAEVEKLREIKLKSPANDIAKAEALVRSREVEVKQAKLALEHCTLTAPVAGEIIGLFVAKGEVFVPQPRNPYAIKLCPDIQRIVRVAVEQEYAPRIKEGMKVTIEDDVSSPGTWYGKVRTIGNIYQPKQHLELMSFNDVRTIEAIVDLDPGQPRLKIGQRVRVKIAPEKAR
jgi:multidrug resistance efflux pump